MKCWCKNYNGKMNSNHFRFQCVTKKSSFRFVERWNCWNCWKLVEFKIPLWKVVLPSFKKYYQAQKCHQDR